MKTIVEDLFVMLFDQKQKKCRRTDIFKRSQKLNLLALMEGQKI